MPFKLALHFLIREWRSGELRILVIALLLAVACLSSIGFFTDRIERSLQWQASELLGGDIVVTSPYAFPNEWHDLAEESNIKSTETLTFPTVLFANDRIQLASVKSISAPYPLRGSFEIQTNTTKTTQMTTAIPEPGTVWLDERLFSALELSIGDTVNVGTLTLTVNAVLIYEPDRGLNWLNLSPRLLMNAADVEKTGVVQPGSRVEYNFLATGQPAAIEAFTDYITQQLTSHQKMVQANENEGGFNRILERTIYYLKIATLLNVALAGIAIASATQRYARRHFSTGSLLRCFGAQQKTILQIFLIQLIILGIASCILGNIAGYGLQFFLEQVLNQLVDLPLPPVHWQPALVATLAGLLVLFSFAVAPILRLKNVSPVHVLRQDILPAPLSDWIIYGLGVSGCTILLLAYTRDLKLTALLLTAGLITFTALSILGQLMIRATSTLRQRVGVSIRYGLANLARHADASRLQLVAFGFTFMAMWLLMFIRTDLLVHWQKQLPPKTPNYFLFNITPTEVTEINHFFNQHQIEASHVYPMIRGRLVQLNGEPIRDVISEEAQNTPALDRELNLTWSLNLPEGNEVIAGQWWDTSDAQQPTLSISDHLADQLGLKLGDKLGFQIADRMVSAAISNKRAIDWNNFKPNFYIIFPPGILDNMPTTYITSFYLPSEKQAVLNTLIQTFPNLTLIDVGNLLAQARDIIGKASLAIDYLLAFTLLVGIMILLATLQNNLDQRRYEGAILRTIGISRYQLQTALAAEFITLGLLAGLLGSTSAALINFYLSEYILNVSYMFNVWLWISAPFLGALIIGIVGLSATRSILKQSPVRVLQSN